MSARRLSPWLVWTRRSLVAVGCLCLAYALSGAIGSRDMRLPYVRFLVAVPIGHELILMPIALATGVLIGRFVPVAARPVIQAALFISAVITIVALPGVLGYGKTADLPSALPRDYPLGLIIVLALVWIVALALLLVKRFSPLKGKP